MNKPKGKQATRGLKQILEENAETVKFYFNLLAISNVVYLVIRYLFFWESFSSKYIVLFSFTSILSWLAFYFMKSMTTPELNENGTIIGAGSDLNMQGHISEYLKDIIIFSAIVQILSLISDYFWFLLLVAPCYVFYLLWKNFLGPWFFAPAPEENSEQQQEKKVKEKRKFIRAK